MKYSVYKKPDAIAIINYSVNEPPNDENVSKNGR